MSAATTTFDMSRCFVRVTGERGDFVEFEFALGEPEIFIEMILTREAFEDFCRERNPVIQQLDEGESGRDEGEAEFDWRLSDAREKHFRH
jgi:phenol hydroxylase P0 protein